MVREHLISHILLAVVVSLMLGLAVAASLSSTQGRARNDTSISLAELKTPADVVATPK